MHQIGRHDDTDKAENGNIDQVLRQQVPSLDALQHHSQGQIDRADHQRVVQRGDAEDAGYGHQHAQVGGGSLIGRNCDSQIDAEAQQDKHEKENREPGNHFALAAPEMVGGQDQAHQDGRSPVYADIVSHRAAGQSGNNGQGQEKYGADGRKHDDIAAVAAVDLAPDGPVLLLLEPHIQDQIDKFIQHGDPLFLRRTALAADR